MRLTGTSYSSSMRPSPQGNSVLMNCKATASLRNPSWTSGPTTRLLLEDTYDNTRVTCLRLPTHFCVHKRHVLNIYWKSQFAHQENYSSITIYGLAQGDLPLDGHTPSSTIEYKPSIRNTYTSNKCNSNRELRDYFTNKKLLEFCKVWNAKFKESVTKKHCLPGWSSFRPIFTTSHAYIQPVKPNSSTWSQVWRKHS